MTAVRYIHTPPEEPSGGQRFAIALTTLMAGAIGALYLHLYWDVPHELTIPLHMDPKTSRVVSWAPWWVPVSIMAVMTMVFWRLFVARARGISMTAAVITMFVMFAFLRHGIEFVCLDYGKALQYAPPLPLWHMIAMFPSEVLGGLSTAGIMFMWGFPGEWIFMLVPACAAGIPTAVIGHVLWVWLK